MDLAVLKYQFVSKPNNMPNEWPAEVVELTDGVPFPPDGRTGWVQMTREDYADHVAEYQAAYNEWQLSISGESRANKILRYTVTKAGRLGLGIYVRWLPQFIDIYRNNVLVPWESMTGGNSLEHSRAHFQDDEPDTSDPCMCNAISCPEFEVGDSIEIEYNEPMTLSQKIDLAPACWDFDSNWFYQINQINTNWPGGPNEVLNEIVPKELASSSGRLQLQSMGCTLSTGIRFAAPCFTPTNYLDSQSQTGRVDFLFPNALIDQSQRLDYSYSENDLRVEIWEFPRRRSREAEVRVMSSGRFNFVGYWTHNVLRCVNTVFHSTGYRNRSAIFGLKLRKLSTNEVSGWLPMRILVQRHFSPCPGLPRVTNSTMWVKFSY